MVHAAAKQTSGFVIHIVLGTKAQLVKMAPVMARLRDREIPYRFVHTGQHQATMGEMLDEFGLKQPDLVLHHGRDVVSIPQMALWMAKILWKCLTHRHEIFGSEPRGIVLVHGDTFSTLLGALMGKVARLRVGHVESGLRSFRLLHPFPEEITRLLTFRLSDTLYCPGPWALANVEGRGSERIDTGCNTLADTLELALRVDRSRDHVPAVPYGLVSLHRYENIFDRDAFAGLIGFVEQLSQRMHLLFILHPPTERQIDKLGFRARLEANPNLELRPRYTYFDFVTLLEGASYVVTDGGSVQEESSYLGLPCLLLRRATERREGLGENVVLSELDPERVEHFGECFETHRREPLAKRFHPSDRIVDSALAWS